MFGQVDHTVGVAPLIIIPRNELNKLIAEHDSGLGIKDGREGLTYEVLRDDLVLGVA